MENWKLDDGLVQFPSGRRIRGRSWKNPVAEEADFSLVLTTVSGKEFASYSLFPGSTENIMIDWPDERLPRRASHALSQLRQAWERSENERVEIVCRTGVGRVGTALAIIAVFEGMAPDAAIEFVRENYNRNSVSSPAQRGFIREYVTRPEGLDGFEK
ncbi:protein-tyrosine phosphatase family protein [Arcanobacterium hippocoleae]